MNNPVHDFVSGDDSSTSSESKVSLSDSEDDAIVLDEAGTAQENTETSQTPNPNLKLPQGFKLQGAQKRVVAGAVLAGFFGFSLSALYGPTVTTMIQGAPGFTFSTGALGVLVAIPNLAGSITRLPFSYNSERHGTRMWNTIALGISSFLLVAICVMFALLFPNKLNYDQHYGLLLIFGAIAGTGISTSSVGILQTSYWCPLDKQDTTLTLYGGIVTLAPGIFTFMLTPIVTGVGLWAAYLIWLCLVVTAGIAHWFLTNDSAYFQILWTLQNLDNIRPKGDLEAEAAELAKKFYDQQVIPKGEMRYNMMAAARNGKNWILSFLYLVTFGGFLGLTVWLPTFYTNFFGAPQNVAGYLAGLFGILVALSRLPGGFLSEKLGAELLGLIATILVMVGSLVIIISDKFGLSVVGSLIMSVGMGINNCAVFHLVYKYLPSCVLGASGLIGSVGIFGGFIIPPIMGGIASYNDGYRLGFIVMLLLGFISAVIDVVLWFKYRKDAVQIQPHTTWL